MSMTDMELLIRDKYAGDASKVTEDDESRLAAGEPLAYVIGWTPFLGLHIDLSSYPLIPRPETEWWTEQLITHLRERFGENEFRFLDLCAGSGAIGLALLKHLPNSRVWFGELMPEHCALIEKNMELNGIDPERADVRESHLFESFIDDLRLPMHFDIIASNPPYIPEGRTLDASVTSYEPHEALFAGPAGMDLITKILFSAGEHFYPNGELWLECDISNVEATRELAKTAEATRAEILNDQYGRPRVVMAYFG